jgi:hypothetical protein
MARLLGRTVSVDEVRPRLVESFSRTFGMEMARDMDAVASAGISLPGQYGEKKG